MITSTESIGEHVCTVPKFLAGAVYHPLWNKQPTRYRNGQGSFEYLSKENRGQATSALEIPSIATR